MRAQLIRAARRRLQQTERPDEPKLPARIYLLSLKVCLTVGKIVYGWVFLDLAAGNFPCLLNNPRERAVLPCRFGLYLFEHILRKVQTLFSLIGTGHNV